MNIALLFISYFSCDSFFLLLAIVCFRSQQHLKRTIDKTTWQMCLHASGWRVSTTFRTRNKADI